MGNACTQIAHPLTLLVYGQTHTLSLEAFGFFVLLFRATGSKLECV